jgi:hypothetical protein
VAAPLPLPHCSLLIVGTITVTPSCANPPIKAISSDNESIPIVFATSSVGAEQQTHLRVPALLAQALDRVRQGHAPAQRVKRDVRRAAGDIPDRRDDSDLVVSGRIGAGPDHIAMVGGTVDSTDDATGTHDVVTLLGWATWRRRRS